MGKFHAGKCGVETLLIHLQSGGHTTVAAISAGRSRVGCCRVCVVPGSGAIIS